MTGITRNPIIDDHKNCNKCKITKPISEFFKRKRNNDGYHTICKPCSLQAHKLKYQTDPEYRKLRIKNTLDSKRKKWYGVDRDLFKEMFKSQKGCCKICRIELDGSRKGLVGHLDHCHTTKKVRGILCKDCNTGLGLYRDNETFLFFAIQYLRDSR